MLLVVRLWDAGDLFQLVLSTAHSPFNSCRLPLRSNLQLGVHYIIPKDVGAGVYFSLEAPLGAAAICCLISSTVIFWFAPAGLEEVDSSSVGSLVGRENKEMQVVLVFFDSGEMHSGKSWRWHLQVLLCHWCNLKLWVDIWHGHFPEKSGFLWKQCIWKHIVTIFKQMTTRFCCFLSSSFLRNPESLRCLGLILGSRYEWWLGARCFRGSM